MVCPWTFFVGPIQRNDQQYEEILSKTIEVASAISIIAYKKIDISLN